MIRTDSRDGITVIRLNRPEGHNALVPALLESLVEHPAIMTHATIPAQTRQKLGIGDALVRLSVGIEDVDDLRADLQQALARV